MSDIEALRIFLAVILTAHISLIFIFILSARLESVVEAKEEIMSNQPEQLDQSVFDRPDCPDWAESAAVNGNGVANYYADVREHLEPVEVLNTKIWIYREYGNSDFRVQIIGFGYDSINWQNSAIDRVRT